MCFGPEGRASERLSRGQNLSRKGSVLETGCGTETIANTNPSCCKCLCCTTQFLNPSATELSCTTSVVNACRARQIRRGRGHGWKLGCGTERLANTNHSSCKRLCCTTQLPGLNPPGRDVAMHHNRCQRLWCSNAAVAGGPRHGHRFSLQKPGAVYPPPGLVL